MADTTDVSKAVQAEFDYSIGTILKYSLVGRSINIDNFLDLFRTGARADAGRDGTLGARYSMMGDRFCIPNLREVASQINHDPAITDVRWAAYMLATTYWETAQSVDSGIPRKSGHGHYRVTETFVPTKETGDGGGRVYASPVMVEHSPGGGAYVTTSEGKTFQVGVNGQYTTRHKPSPGYEYSKPAHSTFPRSFTSTKSSYLSYYGRGYIQLTWWYNYAAAGAALGRGLDFLFNPDLVLHPDVAYKIMSIGMCEGIIFANNHRFNNYFIGGITDYVHARRMVNGLDHAETIADIAAAIENCLLNSVRT